MSTIQQIPVAAIKPSPFNYRRNITPESVAELAESITQDGILQPVMVRPLPAHAQADAFLRYELVFGHRRHAAAGVAKLDTMPAVVERLSDEDVRRLQLAENMQRQNPNALEEAHGLHALITEHRVKVEHLCEQLGKSRSYIYNRLRLLKLHGDALEALEAGEIGADIAQLIAALPAALQDTALSNITLTSGNYMSFRQAKAVIASMMTPLDQATFDHDERYPDLQPCNGCPKLSHNDPGLAGVVDAHVCTDRKCFDAKTRAHGAKLIQDARSSGQRVAVDEQALAYFYGSGVRRHEVMDASSDLGFWSPKGPEHGKTMTWQQLIDELKAGGHLVADAAVVQCPRTGQALNLLTHDECRDLISLYRITCMRADAQPGAPSTTPAQQPESQQAPAAAWPAAFDRLTPEQRAVRFHWTDIEHAVIERALAAERSTDDMRLIVSALVHCADDALDADTLEEFMGWSDMQDVDITMLDVAVLEKLPGLTADELTRLMMLLAILAAGQCLVTRTAEQDMDARVAMAKQYGIDPLQAAQAAEAKLAAMDSDGDDDINDEVAS